MFNGYQFHTETIPFDIPFLAYEPELNMCHLFHKV